MHVLDVMHNERETPLAKALRAETDNARFVLDPSENDYEGPINAWSSNWSEINIHVIDTESVQWLKHGNCVALAWEMHILTGLPLAIVMIDDPHQDWAHAVLKIDDDTFLDIEGTMNKTRLIQGWNNVTQIKHIDPQVATDMEFLATTCGVENEDFVQRLDVFYDDVERELIRDFARIVVNENIR